MSESVFFTLSVVVLAALLYLPVTRLVWALSIRRLERKTGTVLDEDERHGQLVRARLVALLVVILFSLLFNLSTLGAPGRG